MDEEINLGEISIDEDQIQIPSINIPLIKGDKGDTGAKGDDGQDYVITSSDYQEIADIVLDDIEIPTKVSDLDNDEGFIDNTVNDLENYTKTSDLSSVATSGSYNDLSNTPSIPSKTSDLTNDSGFIDKNVNNLTNYYTKSETYTKTEVDNKGYITKDVNNLTNYYKTSETYNKTEVDNKISSVYKYKGTVATYADLPSTSLTIGDVYNVESTGDNYAWTGTAWDKLGGDIDLSNYYNKTQTDTLLNGKQDTLESGTNIKTINNQSILGSGNITIQGGGGTSDYTDLTNKPSINNVTLSGNKTTSDLGLGTYSKPSNGIPKTDLASDVQTSLGKADTAIQEHQDISGKQDITDNNLTTTNKTITSAINEVDSIAKGANQALSYGNYSTMITTFNSLANNVYNVGQNVMIVTLQVPDLWISGIESTSQTYTYTTDEAFTTALNTNGYVQVGYYKLSALETQKVDLTNYVTNTDFANNTTAGVIRTSASYGTTVSGSGVLNASTLSYEAYTGANNTTFVGKGTLENVIEGKGLISNTDYATSATGGVIKLGSSYGTTITSSGNLRATAKTYEEYSSAGSYMFIGKGTLENVITGKNLYSKPSTGIPKTDLDSSVQTSLGKADTAIQSHQDISGKQDKLIAGTNISIASDGKTISATDTTYSNATTSSYGITKLSTSAGSDSQAYALTPRSLYYFANYSIAPYYSSSATYEVGDKVRYNYYLYECNTAITTAEAWNAEHWTQIATVQEQIDKIEEGKKYSTSEKVVGTWIDNRPLYQKTIVLENTTISSSTKEMTILDITNNDVVLVDNMYINCDTSSTAGNRQKIFESFTDNNGHYVNVRGWQNNLLLQTDSLYYINKAYITVKYTKTTD